MKRAAQQIGPVSRRAFLATSMAMVAGSAAQTPALETFTQWLNASRKVREQTIPQCLARIHEMDPAIEAWVQVSPEKSTAEGTLTEIPFGVKDIIETRGLATEYGSPIYKGRIGTTDAAIVRDLRRLGGVVLGKTQAAAFAYKTPPPTHNPRDLGHTPGGSSSGSAAAVAASMVPFTLGTQTAGSILRPASFCGVTGFKPTFGALPIEGVLPFAKSLDTLGFFTHSAADMLALWRAIGRSPGSDEEFAIGVPDSIPSLDPAMAEAFQKTLSHLRMSGVAIKTIAVGATLDQVYAAQQTVMFYEGARFHEQRFKKYGSRLGDLADLVRDGLRITTSQYDDAMRFIAVSRIRMSEFLRETPVILTPAALGPAPASLSSTGDARMNAPWTALGGPAISIPMPIAKGLPLGLQLTADHEQDARVLRTAVRLERKFVL
jgi:Asp-tRNA(Asn)/Glu-tRNA(Gln) amidotransferase A subunit family amidase